MENTLCELVEIFSKTEGYIVSKLWKFLRKDGIICKKLGRVNGNFKRPLTSAMGILKGRERARKMSCHSGGVVWSGEKGKGWFFGICGGRDWTNTGEKEEKINKRRKAGSGTLGWFSDSWNWAQTDIRSAWRCCKIERDTYLEHRQIFTIDEFRIDDKYHFQ